ncbi:uncharacterized protein DEA37_0003654 [Paragonimus westermani]|uniref:Uncharacterized protein n=1 Tax=Paragonimus westermani TaxID=34504 RepID=A0A5J4N821_9TREM|nr:uncharacterized protein DEA37_0003654 [Paragonimus westermani]
MSVVLLQCPEGIQQGCNAPCLLCLQLQCVEHLKLRFIVTGNGYFSRCLVAAVRGSRCETTFGVVLNGNCEVMRRKFSSLPVELCRADAPHMLTDGPVEMVPVAGTSATVLVERPVARRRTSRRLLQTWERYVAVDRRRSIREDSAFCFQQSRTRMIHQSVFLGVLRMHSPALREDPRALMRTPRDCPKKSSATYVDARAVERQTVQQSSDTGSDCTSRPTNNNTRYTESKRQGSRALQFRRRIRQSEEEYWPSGAFSLSHPTTTGIAAADYA